MSDNQPAMVLADSGVPELEVAVLTPADEDVVVAVPPDLVYFALGLDLDDEWLLHVLLEMEAGS